MTHGSCGGLSNFEVLELEVSNLTVLSESVNFDFCQTDKPVTYGLMLRLTRAVGGIASLSYFGCFIIMCILWP